MKINVRLVPLKIHNFLLQGSPSGLFLPLRDTPLIEGRLVNPDGQSEAVFQPLIQVQHEASCYVAVGWDCKELCTESQDCLTSNASLTNIKLANNSRILSSIEDKLQNGTRAVTDLSQLEHFYEIEGVEFPSSNVKQNVSFVCAGAEWKGDSCKAPWNHWEFWVYALLLNIAQITFNTGNSITDAIVVDSIGENGNYGMQRAWGTLGWGLVGTFSGLLVDLYSGSSVVKNYTPAFLICFILGSLDIFTCASTIKVPQLGEDNSNVLKLLGPLLRQPRFFISCFFVLFNGCFDGIVTNFLFVLQDEMAQKTNAMSYLTFLQGITLLVQCATEAPFMFVYEWFEKRLGVQKVLSLVFFAYTLRMWGLAVVGLYGPVWSTLIVELLNGPCFGLGYTVTVAYASLISPPGTSTTVQSILNICFDNLGYALANLAGGILFDVLGGSMMFMVAGFTAATIFILHLLAIRFVPPPEGQVKSTQNGEETPSDNTAEERVALNENSNTVSCTHPDNAQAGKNAT